MCTMFWACYRVDMLYALYMILHCESQQCLCHSAVLKCEAFVSSLRCSIRTCGLCACLFHCWHSLVFGYSCCLAKLPCHKCTVQFQVVALFASTCLGSLTILSCFFLLLPPLCCWQVHRLCLCTCLQLQIHYLKFNSLQLSCSLEFKCLYIPNQALYRCPWLVHMRLSLSHIWC